MYACGKIEFKQFFDRIFINALSAKFCQIFHHGRNLNFGKKLKILACIQTYVYPLKTNTNNA